VHVELFKPHRMMAFVAPSYSLMPPMASNRELKIVVRTQSSPYALSSLSRRVVGLMPWPDYLVRSLVIALGYKW